MPIHPAIAATPSSVTTDPPISIGLSFSPN